MPRTMIESWPSGSRDTTEFPKVEISVGASFRNHLEAFCSMDGIPWNDYSAQAEVLPASDSRLRTYRKMYERLGLIFRENEVLRLSRLGNEIVAMESELKAQRERVLMKPMATAISILSRYQLRNPIDGPDLPISCDVLPCICIWKAMTALNNKLHFEEVNRVILRIPEMAALDAAISKIQNYREQHNSYVDNVAMDQLLGTPVHTDQVSARIAPWFSFAGWGGLIIEQQNADDGYRHLTSTAVNLVQHAVNSQHDYYDTDDVDDWLRYYIGDAAESVDDSEASLHQSDTVATTVSTISHGENVLLYGVPGCGKSHTIKTEYCNDDTRMERAVFHPDYTYSDFVGQILPRVESGHITYRFEPGPFTRILKKAVETPEMTFYLVVEEINRGNAPAIFGDIFQLLDRNEHGCSEYGVSNENVAQYVYGNVDTKIKIPGNLFVLATMNTSDQNVFTLDTAFKRRWTMRMIENNLDACAYAKTPICAWGVTWGTFAKTINQKITELGENNLSNEDNRLGAYFVRESDLSDAERFGEKVLMYLWNDAFKFDRDKVFKSEFHTLDELIAAFIRDGLAVFVDDIVFDTVETGPEDTFDMSIPTAEQYLEGKNPQLVANYQALLAAAREKVPNIYDASVGSLTYAAWKANDIRKASFADVMIQRNKIVIFTEVPISDQLLSVGEKLPVDNHHNHYFKIVYDGAQFDRIVSVIVESYQQLKVQ